MRLFFIPDFLLHCFTTMNLPTFAATLAFGAVAWASGPTTPPAPNTTPAKKATPAAAVRKTTPTANALAKKPATSGHVTAKKAPVVHTTWRNRQLSPTADRYREIQEALVARGYLQAEEANGTWGASSTEAMKKFQNEQTLESTGKIDSLSLIALGLGPRRDATVNTTHLVDTNAAQTEFGRNN